MYAQILGLDEPWTVADVDLDRDGGPLIVCLAHRREAARLGPACGRACPGYDAQPARARRCWQRWYAGAARRRRRPMVRRAKTRRARRDRLLNYGRGPITKAVSEALNRTIQGIKYTAWGFRRRNGFRRAIYFHCGGLHLDP